MRTWRRSEASAEPVGVAGLRGTGIEAGLSYIIADHDHLIPNPRTNCSRWNDSDRGSGMSDSEGVMKRLAAALILLLSAAAPARADLKYTMHMETKKSEGAAPPANPMLGMMGDALM